ncbi:MAG: universal stress protein [Microthrixaceae bacterium]
MRALIATDGTEPALRAAHESVRLLHPDMVIEIVRVIPEREDPNDSATGFAGPLLTDAEADEIHREEAEGAKADLAATLRELGEPATLTVIEGSDAGHEICALAAREGIDVLVVGESDKGWFRRLLGGSVMAYAARHAPCPVLIVRHEG